MSPFMARNNHRKRRSVLASCSLAGALALTLTACSSDDILDILLDDPPPHPGPEHRDGEHLVYDKNDRGDWVSERRYSEEQEKQIKAYREYRQRKDD